MLTKTESKVLFYISINLRAGVSPTYAEIAEGIGLSRKSKGMIGNAVKSLIAKGFLSKNNHGLTIMKMPDNPLEGLFAHVPNWAILAEVKRRGLDAKLYDGMRQ